MRVFSILLFVVLLNGANSQSQIGIVNIEQPPYLDTVLSRLYIYDGVNQKYVQGYRIQLYGGVGGKAISEARKVKGDFLSSFPNYSSHLHEIFKDPYYKVQVGYYRERRDAYIFLKKIEKIFPNAVVIDVKIPFEEMP